MTPQAGSPRSERGVALIVVLMLLAVMSALATGMAVNSHIEVSMASNEVYYAGARAAAEAGMNRAHEALLLDVSTDLLSGADGAVDPANAAAAENADNGVVPGLGTALIALGTSGQYSYSVRIFDDDDPALHPDGLSAAQLIAMGPVGGPPEDGTGYIDSNDRLILQATGFGPSGTVVRLRRILTSRLDSDGTVALTELTAALIVDGSLSITGNPNFLGSNGSVHANGHLSVTGNPHSDGDMTASGTFTKTGNPDIDGAFGGNRPLINVPDVVPANFLVYADYILNANGTITRVSDNTTITSAVWNHSNSPAGVGTWSITGSTSPLPGTYYAHGKVSITGSPGSAGSPLAMSVIATSSISVTGNAKLRPANAAGMQFVTGGDLRMTGNTDTDYQDVAGQILVKEQLQLTGNVSHRGQIIVKNATSTLNDVTSNTVTGNKTLTYDGDFNGFVDPTAIQPATTYTNNVFGWMES